MPRRTYSPDDPMVLACKAAIEKAGGKHALAQALGRKWAAINAWQVVPTEHVLRVAELTKISPHVLRPDRFGERPSRIPVRPIADALPAE